MTEEHVHACLARITYKPGYSFELRGTRIVLKKPAQPNSRDPTEIINEFESRFEIYPSKIGDEQELLNICYEICLSHERHEALEWLKLNNRRLFDPHATELF